MMDQPAIWTREYTVRTFETDFENKWKPACYFQSMQETATSHAASFGYDYQDMLAQNMIWILSRVKIKFHDFPTMRDPVVVRTWPKGIQQKVFFTREFQFLAPDGRPYAVATTAWILIDPSARRMLMPKALNGEIPYHGESALDELLEKIVPEIGLPERLNTTAGYSAVDMMGHVNNSRYIEWMCDCFPLEHYQSQRIDWIQINYLNEVKPGDRVSLAAGPRPEDPSTWVFEAANTTNSNRAFEAALHWLDR